MLHPSLPGLVPTTYEREIAAPVSRRRGSAARREARRDGELLAEIRRQGDWRLDRSGDGGSGAGLPPPVGVGEVYAAAYAAALAEPCYAADAAASGGSAVRVGHATLSNTWHERTGEPAAPPPGHAQRVGLGWIAGTARCPVEEIGRVLVGVLGGELQWRGYGDKHYGDSAVVVGSATAVYVLPRERKSERVGEVNVRVAGSDLERIGLWAGLRLLGELRALGLKLTRLDASVDDPTRRVEPEAVRAAFRARRCVTHLGQSSETRSDGPDGREGVTVYLGRRASPACLRVYGKDEEQKVPEGTYGVRWEPEAHDQRAEQLADTLLGAAEGGDVAAIRAAVWGFVRDLIDFRDREAGAAHGEREELLDWWADLTSGAGPVAALAGRVAATLQGKLDWLARQVAPTLALLHVAHGFDPWAPLAQRKGGRWLAKLLTAGALRLTEEEELAARLERQRGWVPAWARSERQREWVLA